ncbi:BCL-6 corepressor-like protein 1 isoform X1 [Bufo gargarizans]|uniref:BCL-6 corepressor-like protein 1 isoform X1 n=1 Tax=Bufo gargarizans TaxID=30331 RepID=UPI001CF1E454|nr:BCL-6 corepressor-like protein 1 isoform X1 [Bufo gargarizans]XP_044162260.1 BCL-6 corepressor-like protein 1 isoform X1 [Bufo gargarizans]XP_044162261.1 BCL-6 corepressor-like protein 1 isoform X1 [Bufo gargarizans]XP_044162262.1 BCL-6 corepressor-like protein 1 isoform X1 [Bufo gargarizans]
MISAAPLYGGVHNWTSADRVRMCGINEDRRTALSDEESKSNSTQHLGSEDRCVSSVLSTVDLIPATNQSDALMLQEVGATLVETGQKPEDKPPDRTEPEPAGVIPSSKACKNVSPPDGKVSANVSETSIQAASSKHSKKAESTRAPAQEKAAGTKHPSAQSVDADSSGKQKTVLSPGLQIAGQSVDASHAVVSSGFPLTMSRICFSNTQVPNVQKLPLSFPPGAVLTPSQPLVYIPPSSCGQPLSVTTLPTTFGMTSTLTLPIMPTCLTPSELQSHAFASTLGRPLATDPKVAPAELNKPVSTAAPTVSLTNSNSMNPTVDVSSVCTDTSTTTLSALQTLSAHTTLPVVTLASYSRTPNLEPQNDSSSSSSVSPLKSPPQLEREMISPQDSYEMPLDLSSKSHRHKHAPSNQRKTPPMPVLTPVHTSGKVTLSTVLSRSDCSTQSPAPISFTSSSVSQNLRGVPPLVMFPEFLRNGDPVSSQLVGAPGSWIKNSAALISTIPGTYVGVANPVPASLFLNKDSNLRLSTDSRHLAKQEPISIIDQGDPKNSGSCGKKNSQTSVDGQQPTEKQHLHGGPTAANSLCSSKDWTLPGHGTVHSKCPLNGKPSNSQVLPVSWSPYHQTSLLSIGIPATGTLHPSQGSHQRLPFGELTLYSSILPAESKVTPQKSIEDSTLSSQQKTTTTPAVAAEHDVLTKARTCESVSKPRKSHTNKTLLAPKPAAGNAALYLQPGLADKADNSAHGKQGAEGGPTLNKLPNKQNCKDDKIRPPKLSCNRKTFGETKPKNKVLASYMTNDPMEVVQRKDNGHSLPLLSQDSSKKDAKGDVSQDQPVHRKRGPKKAHAPVDTQHCVQEVDLSKVKIERVDDDENFGCLPSFNNTSWSPIEMPPITKVKAKVKKEPGLRGRAKRLDVVLPTKPAQQKSKCKVKEKDEDVDKSLQEPPKKKSKRQQSVTSLEKKEHTAPKSKNEPEGTRVRRWRRRAIKTEPLDPELDPATPERKSKNSFKDFIPVVLKSRTRSQTGNYGFSHVGSTIVNTLQNEEEVDETSFPCKRRKLRKNCKPGRPRSRFTAIKEEPEPELISPIIQDPWELSSRGLDTGKASILEQDDNVEEDGTLRRRKRRRQKNRKYQNGEYLTEKEEEEVSQYYCRRRPRTDFRKRKISPDRASEILRSNKRQSDVRNSLEDSSSLQILEKPPGKRKCKTKHLGGNTNETVKGRGRRSSLSPKSTPTKSPRKSCEPRTPSRSRRSSSFGLWNTPNSQNMPPEARRLIVNKNAGETLLQRAARLGYKDVVLYCLQRDQGDINHRDNAGYTALHEACSRGWTSILQILLENGANVNCSAQDGTRPIHDAVVNDNLETVWLLLSYGADPTLATYSGQTPMKLASSEAMKTFLSDYLSDLRGRSDGDPRASWDLYSSSVLDPKDEIGHDILLDASETSKEEEEGEKQQEEDNFLFEFSDAPLISCYNLHVSLTSGPSNWFLVSDVLKRLKLSSRIFQARYPNFEIASMQKKEFNRQVFTSQILTHTEGMDLWPQDCGEMVELVKYDPELIRLLGSSVEFQCVNS